MTINLHHSVMGPAKAPVIVLLHGLFGMSSNLGGLARSLREDFCVYSVDMPNHGRSDWLDPSDIPSMAQCVAHWMEQQDLQHAHFLGHSLGGKVAMQLALHDSKRVDSLCVADIAPVYYPPHHDSVLVALEAVEKARCRSRSQAEQIMSRYLEEDMLIQFLLMSLRRNEQMVYQWRFNLSGIMSNYDEIRAGLSSNEPFTGKVLFIKGGDSDYILPQHRETIMALFPDAAVKIMPDCGHWLHAQNPSLFNGIVRRFLVRQSN